MICHCCPKGDQHEIRDHLLIDVAKMERRVPQRLRNAQLALALRGAGRIQRC